MTKISVKMADGASMKAFLDFNLGEFLVAEQTGFLGIKISERSIQYFGNAAGGTENTIASNILGSKQFVVPSAVDIKVTR